MQDQELLLKQQLIHSYAISEAEQLSILLPGGVIDKAQWGFSRVNNPESRLLSVDFTKVHTKPSFRMSFRTNRCVVLADSYYIWTKEKTKPERITVDGYKTLVFPAVYQILNQQKQVAIITRKARTSLMNKVEVEPLVFDKERTIAWLDPNNTVRDMILTLSSTPPLKMTRRITSSKIFVSGFNHKSLHTSHREQPSLFT